MRTSAIAILLFVAIAAPAQVVAPAGTMDVTLSFQHAHITDHSDATGRVRDDGIWNIDMRANTVSLVVEYSVTDRLGLGVSVPYVRSRYRGSNPHPGVVVDDGSMHGSMQDLQLDARYALLRGDVILTPFAAFRYPTRDYATMGHAAPGRGLRELEMGISGGYQVLPIPGAVIGASVSYTHPEAIEEIRVNRTNADLQLGYALTPRLFVRGFGAWQRSHGGLDMPVPRSSPYFHHHDQLARAHSTRVGGGVAFAVTDTVSLYASYAEILASVNSHIGRAVSVGTSWRFMPGARLQRRGSAAAVATLDQVRISDGF